MISMLGLCIENKTDFTPSSNIELLCVLRENRVLRVPHYKRVNCIQNVLFMKNNFMPAFEIIKIKFNNKSLACYTRIGICNKICCEIRQ